MEYVASHGEEEPPEEELEFSRKDAPKSGDVSRTANAVAGEYFMGCDDPSREVSIVQQHLDFGIASRFHHPDRKSIVVRNRTRAKVTVTWQVPDSYDGDDDRDWAVHPATLEIGPGKSESFKVAFIPSQDDFYYSQELEAYASFKVCVLFV